MPLKYSTFPGRESCPERGAAFTGHLTKGSPSGLDALSPLFIVVLREPFAQFVSAFDYRVQSVRPPGTRYFRAEVAALQRAESQARRVGIHATR